MKIETQPELIEAVWINCNRISCLGNVSLFSISHNGGEPLPSFYTKFFNKHFDSAEGYNSFFAEVNRIRNKKRFMQMLNEMGRFITSDILIGALTKRQHIEPQPVMEYNYNH